jgi:hypothetical protein
MSRRIIRNNRPKQQSGLMNALSARVPLTRNQIADLALPGYIALDVFARKMGNEALFKLCAQYAVFTDMLCQAGLKAAESLRASHFLQKLNEAYSRAQASGDWTLTDDEFDAARDGLELHLSQLESAAVPQIVTTHTRMNRVLQNPEEQAAYYAMAA